MQVWDVSAVAAAADEGPSSSPPVQLQSTAVVAAHDKDINAVAVSPNDALICTASQDRTAKASYQHAPAAVRFALLGIRSLSSSSRALYAVHNG